jgi:hypothetical protein
MQVRTETTDNAYALFGLLLLGFLTISLLGWH